MPTLRIIADDHARLRAHLFPGDGLEAPAILVCARSGRDGDQLLVKDMILVPYDTCDVRRPDRLTWPGACLEQAVDIADTFDGSVVLAHSHPGGYYGFSSLDDASDRQTVPVLQAGVSGSNDLHGSAIMTPDGRLMCRVYNQVMRAQSCSAIWSIGHDIADLTRPGVRPLAYSSSMTQDLRRHVAVVVGVSGTGSLVAEMLVRLGVGHIVLVDFDRVERRNLNRILNATLADVGRFKTHVVRDAIKSIDPSVVVETFETPIDSPSTLAAASDATVLFSCVDSVTGRYYCDLMVESFLCPLIDVGVMIPTRTIDGHRQIADVCGRIDYVRPGGVSLWSRGEITGEGLSAEYVRQIDVEAYEQQVREGYLQGVPEESPSVISLNMRAASAAVHEWLARLYPIRHAPNEGFAKTYFSLAAGEEEHLSESSMGEPRRSDLFARGLRGPLLGIPGTGTSTKSAA